MDMADGQHSSKRQRHNGMNETSWHSNPNPNPIVLPSPINQGPQGQPHHYQPNRSLSSPHNFVESPGSYEFNKQTPVSMQDPRHLPSIRQFAPVHQQPYHNENSVKTESEVLSPRPPNENGHQYSPPYRSHTYDSNGAIPGVPQYPNHRPQILASPTSTIGPTRQNIESVYVQSPDAAVNSNDGIYNHNQHHYAQPPPNNVTKKKAQRASQACDSCRSLKAKCDESKPCQSCRDKSIECTYRQPEPKAQDKIQTDMLQKIQTILDEVSSVKNILHEETIKTLLREVMVMNENMLQMSKRMQMLEERLVDAPMRSTDGVKTDPDPGHENGIPSSQQSVKSHQSEDTMTRDARPHEHREPDPSDAASDEDSGPPINPRNPKWGIQHTSGAAEMLNWNCIADLVSDEVRDQRVSQGKGSKTDRYLMKAEKRRGEIRLYGYGEGSAAKYHKEHDSGRSDGPISVSTTSWPPVFADPPFDYITTRSPGRGMIEYAVGQGEKEEQVGGLTPDGALDLRKHVVNKLVKNYMDNMNILHPILTQAEVSKLVKDFLAETELPEGRSPSSTDFGKSQSSAFVHGREPPPTSVLGKRSRDQDTPKANTRLPIPQRTPANAVVLLMLGIGKIMEAKKIPEVSWGAKDMSHSDLRKIKGSASPDHSSPSSPISSAHPSPHSQPPIPPIRLSDEERKSITGRPRPIKNAHVIHGMAYVAAATDIIGNELSGSTMRHIQAAILAALYFGQLVRPVQSHAYLHLASRGIQERIRLTSSLLRGGPGQQKLCDPKDNPLVYAFWSCLQLECDIVAELACVHSGILGFESIMPWPNILESKNRDGMSDKVAQSYHAQLWLRSHLNSIHNEYSPLANGQLYTSRNKHFSTIEAVEEARSSAFGANEALFSTGSPYLWPELVWNFQDDYPEIAQDILAARTRAKFYGAQVITYRPFVKAILSHSWSLQHDRHGENPPVGEVEGSALAGVYLPEIAELEVDPYAPIEHKVANLKNHTYWKYFDRGIKALIHSTEAFQGMKTPRLIVTNIFGTLHAQWGNLLVLLACYNDRYLRSELLAHVSEEKFRLLVRTTLRFIKEAAPSTSGLHFDVKILKAAALKAGLLTSSELELTASPPTSDDRFLNRYSDSFSGSNHDT